ncbi:uncharacterized protein I206_100759 [Kwoniella pini CBS 10737]|uniref:3-hydroxyisobutyrate dehydrogenase n=1 Tax=Kwoniella pini CBS 10737 TaxID=1296096 RepID=A0A1B9ICS8_9TREE|nr:uncharacterized protein I206_00568 [Kwoniella pini CBS 10737]OCF53267.1 hypothetical protein I206_00568 [Kwoniella pini CBS 10737]
MTKDIKVGWIGLGAMGSGMASSLVSQGYEVKVFDVYKPSLEKVIKKGAKGFNKPFEVAKDIQVLGLMVVNSIQVEDVLFGNGKVAEVLEKDSVIICFSTVPPNFLISLAERLDALGKNIGLCDCPVSGGSTRAETGELTIMTSGTSSSIERSKEILNSLTKKPIGGLSIVGEKVGIASNFKLINQVFCACQILSQGEVIALCKNWGLNVRLFYNVIKGSSGDSFMFRHRVPWSLNHDGIPKSAMTIISKDIGIVMDESRLLKFPLPLSSISEQIFLTAIGSGMQKEDDGLISKLWENFGGKSISEKGTIEEEENNSKELKIEPIPSNFEEFNNKQQKLLIIGLGIIGLPIAKILKKSEINVIGYDINKNNLDKFSEDGGEITSDLSTIAKDVENILFAVNDAKQIQNVLFGSDGKSGIASDLPESSTVIITSTISPSEAIFIQSQLDNLNKKIQVIDAPISGGPSRALIGDLSIFASGKEEALSKVYWILYILSSSKSKSEINENENLHFIPGGIGNGLKIKLLNNLLATIHLSVTAEALNFAKYKGMNINKVFEVVKNGAAWSYMMVDRVPRMLNPPSSPHATTSTMLKDLNLILNEAKKLNTPLFLGQATAQQFTKAISKGWGEEDDSCLGRLWEDMGVDLRQ